MMTIKTADTIYAEYKKKAIREKMMAAVTHARREVYADPESETRIARNTSGYHPFSTSMFTEKGAA